jgi:hypothetical protein
VPIFRRMNVFMTTMRFGGPGGTRLHGDVGGTKGTFVMQQSNELPIALSVY